MRKKVVVLCTLCVLIMLSLAFVFSGCSLKIGTPKYITDNYENLAENASFVHNSVSQGGDATLKMNGNKTFNTIALSEKSNVVSSFEIYVNNDMIYKSDRIGNFRYCALSKTYTADQINIKVTGCDEENWELYTPQVYLIDNTSKQDFEVMSYIYTAKALQLKEEDKKIIGTTTQFNIFSSLYLLADGSVYFKPHILADGRELDGKEAFRQAIAKIREFNPRASIVATVLGSEDFVNDGLDQEKRHNTAMTKHKDKLIENIVQIIKDYSLDGIAFDYEYPHNLITNNNYASFLKKLKLAMPEGKQLNCAFSLWNLTVFGTFPHSKLKYVDNIELMTYDGFDEYGDHSSFYSMCAEALAKLEKSGVDLSKVNLGLPFYSRPIDMAGYWGNYYDVAEKLGIYGNKLVQTIEADGKIYEQLCYYNSRQLIYDKTAYALDKGIGGVMIWHYGCDTKDENLSLYGAIAQAISDRSKGK